MPEFANHRYPQTKAECKALRALYEKEYDKPVKLERHLTFRQDPIIGPPPQISLKFKSSGGMFAFLCVVIVGGPDDGKEVELYEWREKPAADEVAQYYNGPREEYESYLGFTGRPGIVRGDNLHVYTVAFLMGHLRTQRQHAVSEASIKLLDRMHDLPE